MLDEYFHMAATRDRLRAGVFADHIDDYAAFLGDSRFSVGIVRRYVRTAAAFSRWLDDTGRPADGVDTALVAAFIEALPGSSYIGYGRKHFGRVKHDITTFVGWMREAGRMAAAPVPLSTLPTSIGAFEVWMLQNRGVQSMTLAGSYRPVLIRFLAVMGEEPHEYAAAEIRTFIMEQAPRLSRKRLQTYALVVRMFLRFQATQGMCSPALVGAVPKIAQWRQDRLPKHLDSADVRRILESCNRSNSVGRRNFAMLMLLSRLGLRAGDVTGLRLTDIDWQRARVWVSGKGQRREALPLPQEVGDAMLAYMTLDRPEVGFDEIFVTSRAPYVALTMKSLSTIVVRAAASVNVKLPGTAAHALRHSLATSLLADGVSLRAIGAVLRHRSLDTTTIYAKVDAKLLRTVVRPWPMAVGQ